MADKEKDPPQATGLNQDGAYSLSKRQNEDAWSFLDLPGEVQNTIYLAVLANSGAILTNELRIAMPASLSRVSKQMHAQMCGQAMYCVRAEVTNFDFTQVVTFLDRLSEQDVRLLKAREGKSPSGDEQQRQARFVIHLRFEHTGCRYTDSNLKRWLNRFNKAGDRASDVAFEYVGVCSDLYSHWYVQNCLERRKFVFETEQKKQHMRRIRDAVLQNWQSEHSTLASTVLQQAPSCPQPVPRPSFVPARPCEHCVLARQVSKYRPAKGFNLGAEWVGV